MNTPIIPLVSFPKSGNTWMRFILANLFKRDENFQINFETINQISSTSRFESHSTIEELNSDNAPIFIKEHCSYKKIPYHDFEKAIYIYRDGFDTLLSYWHFVNAQSPGKYKNIEQFFQYYWNGYGSWGEHINSWVFNKKTHNCKVFPIKYEELITNTHEIIRNCVDFLEIEISDQRIENAIIASSRNNMKKMPSSDIFMKSKDKNFHFVRSASIGDSKDELPEICKKVFLEDSRNYETMLALDYINKDNQWRKIKKNKSIKTSAIMKNKYHNIRYKIKKLVHSPF